MVSTPLTPPSPLGKLLNLIDFLATEATDAEAAERAPWLDAIDAALQLPHLAPRVVQALIDRRLQHQGRLQQNPPGAADLAAFCADPAWNRWYPLTAQAYSPLFRDGPRLDLGLLEALQQTPWPAADLRRLRQATSQRGETVLLARGLAADFTTIDNEIDQVVAGCRQIERIRRASAMHVVQIEAYLAATQLTGSLAGHACIDLGSGSGELVDYLQTQGARACGTELQVSGPGLFGIAEKNQFDVVFATGLMEPGAFFWPGTGVNLPMFTQRADELPAAAAALLKPDGLLVVRNVSHPLTFSSGALALAGLAYQPQCIPVCTPQFGGRLAVWRKV